MPTNITHAPSEPCQPIPFISDIGTLIPVASAPNTFIDTEYIPVMIPTLNGKLIFVNPGSNTLPNAIAIPINAVQIKSKTTPDIDLVIIPIAKIIRDKKIVFSIPMRFANFGAKGETNAKASKGTVEIAPTTVLLTPRLSRIAGTNGPTLVIGPLKVEARSIIPMNTKIPPFSLCFI